MEGYDLSAAVALRMKLGHAASSLKLLGLMTGLLASVALSYVIGPWSIAVGLVIGWAGFHLASRLPWSQPWVVKACIGLTAIYALLFLLSTLHDLLMKYPLTLKSFIGSVSIGLPLVLSVRGLLAIRKSRLAQAADLWPPLPVSKARPKFLNKWSLSSRFFVLMAPLVWLFVSISQNEVQRGDPPAPDEAAALGELTAQLLIGFAVWVQMVRLYRRGRRHAMLPGDRLRKRDTRSPVLYLRSFQDDLKLKVWARNTDGRILPERLVRIAFEELVTDHLWRYGPVLAIGDPRTKKDLASLGAARDFTGDDEWQNKVMQLMRQSSMIVMLLGKSEGLVWEFERVASLGLIQKLVLLFPPLPAEELEIRWAKIVGRARALGLTSEPEFRKVRALVWTRAGGHFLTAGKHDDWTYETVLDAAASMQLCT